MIVQSSRHSSSSRRRSAPWCWWLPGRSHHIFFPHYLFPPVQDILARTVRILINWPELSQVLETAARIFAGLTGAFLLGCVVALIIGRSPKIESYITPLLVFLQGIPALSWVIIAIIWFHGTEFRILFIMVITTLPAFTFQILDAYRSMSKDLFEMTMSFRPSGWILFRVLIVPTIVPGILTAWKVNLGNAARVVVVAELVGATGGVGYELLAPAAAVRHGGRAGVDHPARAVRAGRAAGDRDGGAVAAALPAGFRAGGMNAAPFIRFNEVTKVFPRPDGKGTFVAVDRLSFDIAQGEVVAVLGKTGLRQVHHVQPAGRPDRADQRHGQRHRARAVRASSTISAARSASCSRTTG